MKKQILPFSVFLKLESAFSFNRLIAGYGSRYGQGGSAGPAVTRRSASAFHFRGMYALQRLSDPQAEYGFGWNPVQVTEIMIIERNYLTVSIEYGKKAINALNENLHQRRAAERFDFLCQFPVSGSFRRSEACFHIQIQLI